MRAVDSNAAAPDPGSLLAAAYRNPHSCGGARSRGYRGPVSPGSRRRRARRVVREERGFERDLRGLRDGSRAEEGRFADPREVDAGAEACRLAAVVGKDPRFTALVLRESSAALSGRRTPHTNIRQFEVVPGG